MAEPRPIKPCGCAADRLTRAKATWTCSCGEVQPAPRSARARCRRCQRVKGANPRGFGCCGADWLAGATACGDMAHLHREAPEHASGCRDDDCPGCWIPCGAPLAEDMMGRLPHPEVDYLTAEVARGAYTDRAGVRRCVGCCRPA